MSITITKCKWVPGPWTRRWISPKEADAEAYIQSEHGCSRLEHAVRHFSEDTSIPVANPARADIVSLVRRGRDFRAVFQDFGEAAAAAVYAAPHYRTAQLDGHLGIYCVRMSDINREPYHAHLADRYTRDELPELPNTHSWDLMDLAPEIQKNTER